MFKKEYNNTPLFIALLVILSAVIAVFAYLIIKATQDNRNSSDNPQTDSIKKAGNGEIDPKVLETLNAPANTEENSNADEISPEILESLNTPAETTDETNNMESNTEGTANSGTIDPEILKSLNAPPQ